MSHSLGPHGLQHTRLPCPSPSPRVCSNSCPLSRWWHPTVSCSAPLSPLAFNLCQHQGLFQWVSSSHRVAKVLELQLQHQSFQWIFRVDFLWDWLFDLLQIHKLCNICVCVCVCVCDNRFYLYAHVYEILRNELEGWFLLLKRKEEIEMGGRWLRRI